MFFPGQWFKVTFFRHLEIHVFHRFSFSYLCNCLWKQRLYSLNFCSVLLFLLFLLLMFCSSFSCSFAMSCLFRPGPFCLYCFFLTCPVPLPAISLFVPVPGAKNISPQSQTSIYLHPAGCSAGLFSQWSQDAEYLLRQEDRLQQSRKS